MNVCTDSIRFAEQWFSSSPQWKSGLPERMPAELRHVVHQLLSDGPTAFASIELPGPWQSLILVEHAVRSQFDVLVTAMRAGMALPHALICLAGSGDGFHGQRKRIWAASPGNIHLSVFLSPQLPLKDIGAGLTILPAVSLVQTLDSIPGLEKRSGIRWVNDILVDESKVAGFLVHTQSSSGKVTGAVIGIGLNVETVPPIVPTIFVPSVTALCNHVSDSGECSRSIIFHRLLHFLAQNYEKLVTGRVTELLEFYRERSLVMGQKVEVYADVQCDDRSQVAGGTVLSIGDRLELILAEQSHPVFQGRLVIASNAAKRRAAKACVLTTIHEFEGVQDEFA